MKRYDMNLLVALDALLLERSVSGAARRLGIGQPATSAALARLRGLFGDELLVRGRYGMEPTPRALALADPLRTSLAELTALISPIAAFDPSRDFRTFRMSGGDYAGMVLLPSLVELMHREAPGISLRFRYIEKDLIQSRLDEGDIDLALAVAPTLPARFIVEPLFRETFVCAARINHPLFDKPMDSAAFATLDHLLITERGDAYGRVDEALQAKGLTRRIAITVPSAALVGDVLRSTDLVATLAYRAGERIAQDKSIRLFEPPIDTGSWEMSMVTTARNADEPGLDWLRKTLLSIASQQLPMQIFHNNICGSNLADKKSA